MVKIDTNIANIYVYYVTPLVIFEQHLTMARAKFEKRSVCTLKVVEANHGFID